MRVTRAVLVDEVWMVKGGSNVNGAIVAPATSSSSSNTRKWICECLQLRECAVAQWLVQNWVSEGCVRGTR